MTTPSPPPELQAEYFDGLQAAARPVRLRIHQRRLHIEGEGVSRQVAVRAVSWPERQRHGQRQAYLPDHGLLSCADAAAWDAWAQASGLRQGPLVRWMQSWRLALLAALLLVVALGATYQWGLPLAARGLLAFCPPTVDAQIGELVLPNIRERWLAPSKLPPERQAALRHQFTQAVQRHQRQAEPGSPPPAWTLHFHATRDAAMGPNAFALPGGHLIVTDAMVELLADRPDVLMGVLGHELGHVEHRHGMRMLVQTTLLAALTAALVGDFSSVLAAAPALLGQLAYSRGFEHQADETAAALMRANGHDPAAFAVLFERLAQQQAQRGATPPALPIGLSSHPPDAERIERMKRLR